MNVLIAMGVVVLIWLVTIAACQGWGTLVLRIGLGYAADNRLDGSTLFWTGLSVVLGLLQLWHCFLAVTWLTSSFFAAVGVAVWLVTSGYKKWSRSGNTWYEGAVFICVGAWLANRGLDFARNYDSGVYHFSTIRWLNEYPIVPGLGNLNVGLAFNQSYFLFVALLNAYPFFNEGYHVASSLLIFILATRALNGTLRTICKPNVPLVDQLQCVLLPIIVLQGLSGNVSSPSPDIAVFVFGIAVFTTLVAWLEQNAVADNGDHSLPPIIILICIIGCTLKLSFGAYAAAVILVLLRFWRPRLMRRTIFLVCSMGIFGGGIYAFRGFVLSGYPAFPLTMGGLPFDWKVPLSETQDAANWIYSWARTPGVNWRHVLGSWDWLGAWRVRIFSQPEFRLCAEISGLALLTLGISVYRRRDLSVRLTWHSLPFLPVITGIVAWFFTAPDPRFGNWLFWLFASWTTSCACWLNPKIGKVVLIRPIAFAMMITVCIVIIAQPSLWLGPGGHAFAWLPNRPTKIFATQSGLQILLPAGDDARLWDAPLPSAVQGKPALELRGKTLSEGFRQSETQAPR
jgi:hypothetical protein